MKKYLFLISWILILGACEEEVDNIETGEPKYFESINSARIIDFTYDSKQILFVEFVGNVDLTLRIFVWVKSDQRIYIQEISEYEKTLRGISFEVDVYEIPIEVLVFWDHVYVG